MSRVLVTEKLAESGLDAMRAAGLDVDVQLGLSADELLGAVAGAQALIVRSATQVNAAVLEAADDLVVVGRAGIGVDNIDVEAATRRGVMVVNAPNSIALANAEHTMALLLAMARNVAQADRDLHDGGWNRTRWVGVELHDKTRGIVGLGRVGVLVAQRARAFGMRIIGRELFMSDERARQLGVELMPTLEDLVAESDFLVLAVPKLPENVGMISADLLRHAKPTLRIVNTSRGGLVDEVALAAAISEGRIAGAALDVFEQEPLVGSPLLDLDQVVVTPHLGASTSEAQDKAGQTIAEQVVLALRGAFVPFAVNLMASEANASVQPFMPLAERLGRLFTALAGGVVDTLEISYEGEIAGYDCRVLTLAILKGVLSPVLDEPVSFVNAPALAEARGLAVRETSSSSARDYVNLVELRGHSSTGSTHVAGTLYGKQDAPRIVAIDDYIIDLAPSSHMLVVRNQDTPGMIGRVCSIVGIDNAINIDEFDLGKGPAGDKPLMVLSTSTPVSPEVIAQVRALEGVVDAQAIELG
ncbi:MAG: phosphoglycerate dehydrogenase [Acidimicrobiia bacterium]